MSTGEEEITQWFARQRELCEQIFPIGIGDDMAQVRIGRFGSVLITTDMLLDGVHFDLAEATPAQVGYKAMAVSLSDCAAMATIPVGAVVSVALPNGFGQEQLKQLHEGIVKAADKFDCALIGGDITSWGHPGPSATAEGFVINVAMLSRPAANRPVRRSGAKVGDCICVTGTLGGSYLGRHLNFTPRVKEALKLAELVEIHSMIDISDGLSSDMRRICTQSGVGALVYAERIPVSEAARKTDDALSAALNDGEDFELLFTLEAEQYEKLKQKWDERLSVTEIGRVTDTDKVQIEMPDGEVKDLRPGGYDHLKD